MRGLGSALRHLLAREIVWVWIVVLLAVAAGGWHARYWIYSQGMPGKCEKCGLNHDGPCPLEQPKGLRWYVRPDSGWPGG